MRTAWRSPRAPWWRGLGETQARGHGRVLRRVRENGRVPPVRRPLAQSPPETPAPGQGDAAGAVNAHIRFASAILRRLGEELNTTADQGILELVKNAYDADARECTVELIGTDHPGGAIRVTDTGDGMTRDTISDGWMVIGHSSKAKGQRTRLGRIPAGDKGLGRLAALRMGTTATIVTRPRGERDSEYTLSIDWNMVDASVLVEDVAFPIGQGRRAPGAGPGTEVRVENLSNKIGRIEVRRLARALILLADPFADDPSSFVPTLSAPEFKDLEDLVRQRYFEHAEYHLRAEVREGIATASVEDWRGKVLFTASHGDIAKKGRPKYLCPHARFDLWVFILDSAQFSTRKVKVGDVRTWLEAFGGVHLYENGLRVSPYGNAGNDWLDMNLHRVRSPEERPGTNTSIGRVVVTDTGGLLQQKTDRSGFIETDAFLDLRAFAQDAMDWMARRRLEVVEKKRLRERAEAPSKSREARRSVEHVIGTAPKNQQKALQEAFNAYAGAKDKEVYNLRKEVQLYRTLSTAGITAATFAHESTGNPLKVITQAMKFIERLAKKELADKYSELEEPVQLIKAATKSVAVLGTATLGLLEHEKRRIGRVDVHETIRRVVKIYEPFLRGRAVDVKLDLCAGNPYLRGSEAAVESILTNLLNNSMVALERSEKPLRQIVVQTTLSDDRLTLRVQDNGPGIEDIRVPDIWLPGQTTRENGTGLGLTIVHDAAKDLGGDVDALAHGALDGAEIIVCLPLIGV